MQYILMHKNQPVAELDLDASSCAIIKVNNLFAPEHLPVGVAFKKGQVDRAALNAWWRSRAIPSSRDGIRQALEKLQIPFPELLLEKCFGLSLSDHYWICPQGSGIQWDTVNFFTNPFSGDVGNILLGHASSGKNYGRKERICTSSKCYCKIS